MRKPSNVTELESFRMADRYRMFRTGND
jgi:hypothetical protein